MNYTKEQKLELYKKLPPDIQEMLMSEETAELLHEIAKKNGLLLDKISDLSLEVSDVLLGISSARSFTDNIRSRLKLSNEQINAIAQNVNEKIFEPIRESLKEVHGEEDGELAEVLDDRVEPIIPPVVTIPIDQNDETLKQTRDALKELGIEHIANGQPSEVVVEVPTNLPTEPEITALEIPKPTLSNTIAKPLSASLKITAPEETVITPPATTGAQQTAEVLKVESNSAPGKATPDDIFASKLTGTISVPDQKIDMSKGAVNKPSAPYKIDPYREPIN